MTKVDRHFIKYLLQLPEDGFLAELRSLGVTRTRELFSLSPELVAKANIATK